MKTIFIKFAVILGLSSFAFSAPSFSQTNEEMKAMQDLAAAETKLIYIQGLKLTEEEGDNFWPIYEAYREELKAMGEENLQLIQDFAAAYQSMTDDVAYDLTNRYFSWEKKRLALRVEYREKMAKVISPTKVAIFVQIENKITAIARYQLAAQIPLMQE